MVELIHFIILTCIIWLKMGLGHETLSGWDETETLKFSSRWDTGTSRGRDIENETTTPIHV